MRSSADVWKQRTSGLKMKIIDRTNASGLSIDLSTSIKSMTTEIKTMTKEIEKMGKRLETLEGRDGATWRTAVSHVVTAVVGAVICYIFAQIGM